ncbi:hypothetical protein MMC30_002070 [Trapelia coarctata]|nr:hypothetical protein [Trapelia coarctata]
MDSSPCPILLLDGGLGTTLESPPYKVKFSTSTPLWSSHLLIEAPEAILAVQTDFVKAGCDVLLTATYQASYEGFAVTKREHNQSPPPPPGEPIQRNQGYDRTEASMYMRKAVDISREALLQSSDPDKPRQVALSLGAYGACMIPSQEYTGNYKPAALRTVEGLQNWHLERLGAFSESPVTWGKIDLIAFETIPVLSEIHAARQVISEVQLLDKKWYISCVFPNEDLRLPDGSSVEEVARAMLQDGKKKLPKPWGIGINCTKVKKLERLIDLFEDAVGKMEEEERGGKSHDEAKEQRPWLVLYPDGATHLVYNTSTQEWQPKDERANHDQRKWDEEVFQIVKQTQERGFWRGLLVGGCCKTSPEDISSLRARLNDTRA